MLYLCAPMPMVNSNPKEHKRAALTWCQASEGQGQRDGERRGLVLSCRQEARGGRQKNERAEFKLGSVRQDSSPSTAPASRPRRNNVSCRELTIPKA